GELCGVPFPDDHCPLLIAARQDPRIMAAQVEQAWLDALRILARRGPLLVVLEDLHWSDALTVRLIGAGMQRKRADRIMVLALARPELVEQAPSLASHLQTLQLQPLSRRASASFVREMLGEELATNAVEHLCAASEGSPLFLEELVRAAADG